MKNHLKELLSVSLPLIISSSIWTIQHFVDRMFISWYSVKTLASVMPSSFLNLTTMSIFTGIAGIVNTFVAQYYGSKNYEKIGKIVWQGIYLGIIGGIFHFLLIPVAPYFFKFFSHQKDIINYEIIYFQILCIGAFPSIASVSLSSFFSGQGRTKIVLFVSSLQTFSHLILDYLLIFGKFIFLEMGIKGAGIATIISGFLSFFTYLFLFLNKREEIYNVKDFKFDKELFNELLKFGVPNGVYYFLDISVWTIFLLIIGKLGITPLSSTNIAFNVNTVAFMPMLGIGTGVSILIGNYIGENKKEEGERIAFIGFFITFIYMFLIALSYVLIPDFYIKFFKPKIYIENFEEVRKLTIILLRFVAFYSLFDTMNIIFISALRGAGDTKFIMNTFLSTSIFLFLIPLYILIFFFSANVFIAWIIATFYVIINGIIFFIRFLKGSWKKIDLMKIERGIYGR